MKKIPSKTIIYLVIVVGLIIVGFLAYQNMDLFLTSEPSQRERTEKQEEHPELLIEDLILAKEGAREGEEDESSSSPFAKAQEVEYGDTIVVHYVGMFLDGSVFDSSVKKNRPFVFKVGVGNVIKGWNIGVEGMRVGDKRKLTVPPELAYGKGGVRGLVEPDTTVVFEIELLEIKE